ncbi:DUF4194 domain-containing protein [Akkermansiaceae bacterium]|nr:DUF4194 domain-containing protein [Akkermansiaceae bacterium]
MKEQSHNRAATAEDQLEPEDEFRTDPKVSQALQELLRYGFIELSEKPQIYKNAKDALTKVNLSLEPLQLRVQTDDPRGLIILVTYDQTQTSSEIDESWSHALVRRQRLTLEQSLLVALLRRHYLLSEQDRGIGIQAVKIYLDELVNELITFIGDSGSDLKNTRRVTELLNKLKEHGITTAPNQHGEIIIRPLIVHLADPSNLNALLEQFQATAQQR